jgi:hypothetical protein
VKSNIPIQSTARNVEQARKELLAAFSRPSEIPLKVAAYTAAVKQHREYIFSDVLRDPRTFGYPGR